MFVREKTARGHAYLYLVENEREGTRVRQRIIRALGRKDVLIASGELKRYPSGDGRLALRRRLRAVWKPRCKGQCLHQCKRRSDGAS